MSLRKHQVVGLVVLLVGGLLLAWLYFGNAIASEIVDLYCRRQCRLLSDVSRWEHELGEPQVPAGINRDEGILYWPDKGVAVKAGPLYEAQARRVKSLKDRKVTSVFIPCTRSLPLSAFGLYTDGSLTFDSTPLEAFPDSSISLACRGKYRRLFLFSGRIDSDEIWLSNMPFYLFGRSAVIVHFVEGRPATIELVESNILSWYD